LASDKQVLAVESIAEDKGVRRLTLRGKGGAVRMPRTFGGPRVTINGEPAELRREGLFDLVVLPAGRSVVEVRE
jgi:hypothetical protein